MPSDADLMRAVAAGDRAALSTLMERHQNRVLRLAYRFTGRWDLAEDIAQETFLNVFRVADRYRPDAAFSTWLYRIVVNRCWDVRRGAGRDARLRVRLAANQNVATALDSGAEERAGRVRDAVAALPERQRLAVILHRFDGLSHRQIAEVTGWTTGAVESCLVRAYETLRKSLRDLILE